MARATPATPRDAASFLRLVLASPRLSAALSITAIGTAVLSFALRQTIGWPGLIAILAGLVTLTLASLAAKWKSIEWHGLLPLSMLVFAGWAAVSVFWSQYHWVTFASLLYLAAFTIIGLYVALARDTIQIVRAFGDVLRFVLALSLALEIFSGLLIDTPIRFLGIAGNIGNLGPIQGLMGTRNQLGLTAVLALVTFGTEFLTRSITTGRAVFSVVLAVAALLLTRAPLAFGAAIIVIVAAAAVWGLRKAPTRAKPYLQVATLLLTAVIATLAWLHRHGIVRLFNAGGDLNYRLGIWRHVWTLIQVYQLQGWGWIGIWHDDIPPFQQLAEVAGRVPQSSLNAYLDVWFQLGFVGFLLFVGFVGLTFTRSWLLASRRRNVVFVWPALVMVVLIIGALAESSLLIEFGWLTLVVSSVKAAQELSWRRAFREADEPPTLPTTDR